MHYSRAPLSRTTYILSFTTQKIIIATGNILEKLIIATVNILEILIIATVNILEILIITTVNIVEILIATVLIGVFSPLIGPLSSPLSSTTVGCVEALFILLAIVK